MAKSITFEFTALHEACLDFVVDTWHGHPPSCTTTQAKHTSSDKNGDPITISGFLTVNRDGDEVTIQGKGNVTYENYHYSGSWDDDRFTLTSLLTDRFMIDGNWVTFGEETRTLSECQVDEDYTLGFPLTETTKIYLPLLPEGDFLIKANDGTKFDLCFNDSKPDETFLLFDSTLRVTHITHHINGKCSINGHDSRVFGNLCITKEDAFVQWSITIGKGSDNASVYCRTFLSRAELLAYIAGKGDKKDLPFMDAFEIKTPTAKISEVISNLFLGVKITSPTLDGSVPLNRST